MRAVFLWVLPCMALLVRTAAAQPSGEDAAAASELYASGAAHYQRGEYDEAIRDFGRAYQLSRAPDLLFNLAQAHRLKGSSCRSARDYYRRYLELVPATPDRAEVEARIAEMDRCVQLEITAAAAAKERTARGREVIAPRRGPSLLPWVVIGVGAALGVGGTVLSVSVDREYDRLSGSCDMACDRGTVQALETRGWVGVGLLAGGGAAIAAGVALLIRDRLSAGDAQVTVSATGTGVAVGARF